MEGNDSRDPFHAPSCDLVSISRNWKCYGTAVGNSSTKYGVPKGTRTYVDGKTPRKGADRGLSLPLADGGFNAGVGIRCLAVYEPV